MSIRSQRGGSGLLITFEGLDGSGKSTQARMLVERFAKNDDPALLIREPGGTNISERIREILLNRDHAELEGSTELFLFSASRAQLTSQVIKPALERGEIVVCDRFADSTLAYQGFGRGIDRQTIREINRLATDGITPDLTFFLDVSLEEMNRRLKGSGKGSDRMETSGREFYQRVLAGYREMAQTETHRYVVVDGTGDKLEIGDVIWKEIQHRVLHREDIKREQG